jgi:hypothetical protein
LVSTKGIEANPSKIEAILRMEPPKSRKGAQRLTGRLASLNRFISRSVERNLPFFEVLKTAEVLHWGPTQQKAFEAVFDRIDNLNPTLVRNSITILCSCFPRCG